jgi:hypothetical protein
MKKIFLFLLLSFSAISFNGCSSGSIPTPKMLVGKYFYSHNGKPSLNECIWIYPDGSYKYQLTDSGQVFEVKDRWKFDSAYCEISFKKFRFRPDGPSGTWISRVRMDGTEIKLMYSSEDNIYYSKKIVSEKYNEYNGVGSVIKKIELTGEETTLELLYDFYNETDQLVIQDQNGKELYNTTMKATVKSEKAIINLCNVITLVFRIESKVKDSKWKFSIKTN